MACRWESGASWKRPQGQEFRAWCSNPSCASSQLWGLGISLPPAPQFSHFGGGDRDGTSLTPRPPRRAALGTG